MRYEIHGFTIECLDELIISLLPKTGWVTDAQWVAYMDKCVGCVQQHGPFRAWLIVAGKEGPTTEQRRVMTVDKRDGLRLPEIHRSCMVTSSILLRGILTAAAWRSQTEMETKAVAPGHVKEGLEWLHEKARFDVDGALKLVATHAQS